jgi:N-acetylmuramoyl-L-alanine amidase
VRPPSRELAELVSQHVETRLKAVCTTWRHRGVWTGNLSEISPHWNSLQGILVELGFHDSRHDTQWLPDEGFQSEAALAIAEGISAWRARRDAPVSPLRPSPE